MDLFKNHTTNQTTHRQIITDDKVVVNLLETIKSELNSDKFEKLVRSYFMTLGAISFNISEKHERDNKGHTYLIAVFEKIKLIIYTQVKYQKGQTSEWGTTQFLDFKINRESIDDGYNKIAWVISSANSFKEKAVNIAKKNNIQLINGYEFSKMLLNVGIRL
jgi:hypothetical protein